MAYNNMQNLFFYDGNKKIYIAGTNYIKDLVIHDLTLPLGLIQYTDRYKQAQQLYDNNKDKIDTIVSHSLGSIIAHHLILDNEQLKGRLYATQSLARPHDLKQYFSHYGDPIAMFNLYRTHRKL
jgi:hypothetical protein